MKDSTLLKEYSKYTIFNVLGMLGLSCYILADTFFVANGLGSNGLTALNLAIPIYSFIHGSGLMLGMGAATKYMIYKSRQEHDRANRLFTHTLLLGMLLSLLYIIIAFFFSTSITTLLGADQAVSTMTHTYLKVLLLFSPAFILNDILLCFTRNDNDPRLAMFAMIIGSLSNVVLDYIFIFPMKMGIFGAVFATGLAPIISIAILSTRIIKKKHGFHLIKTKLQSLITFQTCSLGFPSLISEMSSGIVIIVFNILILSINGNIGVAAYGIIANLSLVVVAIFTGIAQGIQPLISQAYALHDLKSSKTTLRYALLTMFTIAITIYTFIYLANDTIIALFNSENNILLTNIASVGLKLYFTCLVFMGFNIILCLYFTSMNTPRPAHIISILRGLLLVIPIAFLFSNLWGMHGVWLSIPICEFLVAIVTIYFLKRKKQYLS